MEIVMLSVDELVVQSDYRILRSSMSFERINLYLSFLHGVVYQVKVAPAIATFGWV